MKRFLLMTLIFTCIFSLAQAQRGSGERPSQGGGGQGQRFDPAQMVERQVKELKDTLSLTDAQTTKVKEIITKSSEERSASFQRMRDSGEQIDREERRKQMEASATKESNEIKALLNDTQKAKYEKYLKNREARMQEMRNQRSR